MILFLHKLVGQFMNQLDLLIAVKPTVNDNDLTKKPKLSLNTSDDIIRQFYGQNFLNGWLKVKDKRGFKTVIKN